MIAALEAEQRRIREQQHALAVRGAHIDAALLRARQGVEECIVRANLEAKGIVVLANPPAHAESRS